MIYLNEESIKKVAGEVAYQRGLHMYLTSKVESIDVEEDTLSSTGDLLIDSYVESSSGYDSYNVCVKMNAKKMVTDFECDCPAFFENWGNGMCKHVVAVLLKLSLEGEKIFNLNNLIIQNKSCNLIGDLKKGFRAITPVKNILNLDIKYEFDPNYGKVSSVELKVGDAKLYVIKNMKDFLKTVAYKKNSLTLGKNFTYDPNMYKFNTDDEKIIELLLELYDTNERIENSKGNINNITKFLYGKKAILSERQLKRFFYLSEDRKFNAVIAGTPYCDVKIVSKDLPLDFSINYIDKNIVLNHLSELPIPLTTDGEYFFYANNIYRPSIEQNKIYTPLYNSLISERKKCISFESSYGEDIASYVIPSLKKVSNSLIIGEALEKDFYEETLIIQFYFDKVYDGVSCEIKFNYGNVIINPLSEEVYNNTNGFLIRDVLSETKAINTLLNFGFLKSKQLLLLNEEERIVTLLSTGIQELQKLGDIYYSEAFKDIKIYSSSSFKSTVRLNSNDLLEFNFHIEGVENSELKQIFNSIKEKKKFFRLKKGGFIPLDSPDINVISNLIEYMDIKDDDLTNDSILLPKYNAVYFEQNLKDNNITFVEKNKEFKSLINTINNISKSDFSVPNHLNNILRSYQKTGFRWFKTLSSCEFGGILADEMGLGKTIQAIAFIESELKELGENKKPVLVVSPSSLIYNWESEIEKFSPSLNTLVISGSKNERELQIKDISNVDIVITSYPLIRRDIDEYKKIYFSYCFLDEAQQIKNPSSQNAKAVKEIKAKGYFALTGTPIENSLTELWSIFDFIMPGYLMSHSKFMKKYEIPIVKNKNSEALESLNRHIKPFILRRYKHDVVKELPPKIEHKMTIEMTGDQKKLYAAYLASTKNEIAVEISQNGFNKSKIKILALLTRLRQICCDPSIFIENYNGDSGKMLALDDLLYESINADHRILLFSQFTSVLRNIEKRLHRNSIEYMYLDGQTPVKSRLEMVDNFNSGAANVFLISLKAGGTGLNLTGADVVINFDPWWNPAVEDQAVDRAHRIGQKKTVEVLKLISRDTIEEKIYDLQERKKGFIKGVLNQDNNADILLSSLTESELEELFK